MHVTGASSPYGYFKRTQAYVTADVSALITQDVLLLAGRDDHLVPMVHFYDQIKSLTNARSITTRHFTASESAGSHCQVGNYGLAFRTIVNWLDELQGEARGNQSDTALPPIGGVTARLRGAAQRPANDFPRREEVRRVP